MRRGTSRERWKGGMGRRALNQEASQSLAGTAGEGNWDASGGACEERSRGARWEERECVRGSGQLLRGSKVQLAASPSCRRCRAALACLLLPAHCLPPLSLNHLPTLKRCTSQYSTWYDATRRGGWTTVRSIVYLPQRGPRAPAARTCDLWGRLLQGEQQSVAAVGWGGLAGDGGGWHEEAAIAGAVWWLVRRAAISDKAYAIEKASQRACPHRLLPLHQGVSPV